jgi:hypothetical protein
MSTSSYEGGIVTTDTKFGFVLKMYERRKGAENDRSEDIHKDTYVGNAVLVAPQLAITAVHCLADPKSNLWVRSALGGNYVRVVSIGWRNQDWRFVLGSLPSDYPPVRRDNWAEDIVALFLEGRPGLHNAGGSDIPVVPASVGTIDSGRLPRQVGVASADGSVSAVRYSTFSARNVLNKIVMAEVSEPVRGYPLESGSAALDWDRDTLTTRLLGLQVSAPDPMPLRLSAPDRKPVIGIFPLDADCKNSIGLWCRSEECSRQNMKPASTAVDETAFHLRGAVSQRAISGERALVTVNDLRFFDDFEGRLHATRSRSGILTSGGTLHTRLVRHNEILLTIRTVQTCEEVVFRLYPSSALGVGGFYWLQGAGEFRGRRYFVYLFRAVDDPSDAPIPNRRRVRVAVFDAEGPHLADRPEYNEIVLGVPFVADDDRVQDDIGNGHEGQDPP